MLEGAGLRKPTAVFAHGFLTVNGQKMSKSRGTFIKARTYLDHLNPEYLRYYFATKLSSGVHDIDLNLDDFAQRVNADLVNKVINIAARCEGFIHKQFQGMLVDHYADTTLYTQVAAAHTLIAHHYEQREYGHATREIMALADLTNQYIDEHKPWILAKESAQRAKLHEVCSLGINLFRLLITYLQPIIPITAGKALTFLNVEPLPWSELARPLTGHRLNPFEPLMVRVERDKIAAMLSDAQPTLTPQSPIVPPAATANQERVNVAYEPISPMITFDDFAKIDLRIARIVKAEQVEGAEKLLQLTLDIGGESRQVFAGIKAAYTPEMLEGRLTVVVANLAPRKMRFGTSAGMVLAAGAGGEALWLLSPDSGAQAGMRVK
ncbi:MAG: methionyl-tRNA synthetase, partial [Halothiobacillaceae bacterium]